MAGELQIARRYAHAYFDLARQAGDVATWREALRTVTETLTDEQVATALEDPRLPSSERLRLVEELLGDVAQPARNLARLLVERGRAAVLPLLLEEYDALADRASGVTRAEVLTAVPVDKSLEQSISRTLSQRLGGEVHTTVRQDPSILGGLVIRIGDRVIDTSVRTRLAQLQAALA
jgi:F-type H+-transporting ATPase subunit delta